MNMGPPGRYDEVGDVENRFPIPDSIPAQHQPHGPYDQTNRKEKSIKKHTHKTHMQNTK